MNLSDYHKEWRSISRQIRDQAGNRCEECGVANGQRVYRAWKDGDTVIVLTVHHRCDCDKRECRDPTHMVALCQACHLAADLAHHLEVQAANRRSKRAAGFAGMLFEEELF